MIEWLLIAGGVAALILFSGDDKKKDTVATPRGNLPLSGKARSACPNVHLPIFEGAGKGELLDIPEEVRAVYADPLKIDPASFIGDGEMAKATREMNAEALDNLALQAECAGYLGVAQKLYDHAKKIRGDATPVASSTNNEKEAIATTSTTRERLEEDFAELPEALREYVGAFVLDFDTLPEVFVDGADLLVGGDPENVARVGLDFDMSGIKATLEESTGGAPIFPAEAATDFLAFTAEEMKTWYFPRAAARLRRIAIERAQALNLPNPFPSAPAAV